MANIPAAPLEGTSSASVDTMPMPFYCEDDGASALRAVLWKSIRSAVVNSQRLAALRVSRTDPDTFTLFDGTVAAGVTVTYRERQYGARGLILTVDVTATTGSPSLTFSIGRNNPSVSYPSLYETLFSNAAAITATGTHSYVIYPGTVAAGDVVEVAKLLLPNTWALQAAYTGSGSMTLTIGGTYLI